MKSSNKKTKLKNKLSKSGRGNSKQDQYDVPNNERLEVVESMPAEHDQNVVLNSAEAIQCDNNFHAQQQHDPMVFDDFEVSNMFTNKTNMMLDDSSSLYDVLCSMPII